MLKRSSLLGLVVAFAILSNRLKALNQNGAIAMEWK